MLSLFDTKILSDLKQYLASAADAAADVKVVDQWKHHAEAGYMLFILFRLYNQSFRSYADVLKGVKYTHIDAMTHHTTT